MSGRAGILVFCTYTDSFWTQVRAGVQRWQAAHLANKPTLCGLFVTSVAGVVSCCLCRPFWPSRRGGTPAAVDFEPGTVVLHPDTAAVAPAAPHMARVSVTSQGSVQSGSGSASLERRSAGALNRSSLRQALFPRNSPSPQELSAVSLQLGDQVLPVIQDRRLLQRKHCLLGVAMPWASASVRSVDPVLNLLCSIRNASPCQLWSQSCLQC